MSIEKKLLGTTPVSGAVDPEGVSFDGSNDYLSRSSDMTGNADGKTFTFSCWVYGTGGGTIYHSGGAGFTDGISIHFEASGELNIKMDNPSGSTVFSVEHGGAMPLNTWNHLLISCDMSSTSNRHIYVSDAALGNTYLTYTNSDIDFTSTNHSVNKLNKIKGRLSHLFLDYTYRDLSVTANRRLFIDSDGKPSDTIPSSPILYLPMTDAATAGSNSGTGGDFTVNGVLDTAGRGPNQWNCSASTFDGSADYLSRSSIAGISDGKEFTFSINVRGGTNHGNLFSIGNTVWPSSFDVDISSDFVLRFGARNSADTSLLSGYQGLSQRLQNATNNITMSIDLTNQSISKIAINGVILSYTFNTFVNDVIDFTDSAYYVGNDYSGLVFDGSIGELYFDTNYIDLSTDNPFWDADANRPKPVQQVISETGTTPLIALPLRGDDAGNNLGTGGDFTVNSGPYTGARGGSEYWARSIDLTGGNGTVGHCLSRSSALTGASDGKTMTFFCVLDDINRNNLRDIIRIGSAGKIRIEIQQYSTYYVGLYVALEPSSSGSSFAYKTFNTSVNISVGVVYIFVSFDITSSALKVYISNEDGNTFSGSGWQYINTNNNAPFSESTVIIGGETTTHTGDYAISNVYLSTGYTDFSQESNRNLFVDQLGYPKDLTPAIDAGDIAEPLIYMKFDDTSALGTNSGTGGNFTVNGTVTAGADVDP